ncbi:uncharacterized protein [Ptychodera flava]|uniref:uncharacterized protein n=1 Tax=Ptychodera flava TaxID=63121 RepID=UPI003969E890
MAERDFDYAYSPSNAPTLRAGSSRQSHEPTPEYRDGSRNRGKRQFAKRLLIGLGITEIVMGFLLIGFGAGGSALGSKMEFLWAPYVGGFLTIFVGIICTFSAFRKENYMLIFTASISIVNALVVGFLVIYSAAGALTRNSQCTPGDLPGNDCDNASSGGAVAMDGLLIFTTVVVIVCNMITSIFCIRIAFCTYHEDTPHVVVT